MQTIDTKRAGLRNGMLVLLTSLSLVSIARADTLPPDVEDPTCPSDLKAEVLHNLWKRPRAAKPGKDASTVMVGYRNDYGAPADALLIAIDGVPTLLRCKAPEGPGAVFLGRLAPGIHYVDAVYNFGPGRVGRTPHALKVKKGIDLAVTVFIDRDEHEHPTGEVEETPTPRSPSK